MARQPSPQKAHKPKDFCTIEQAEFIAGKVAAHMLGEYDARIGRELRQRDNRISLLEKFPSRPWYKRVWQALTRREA